MKKVFHAFIILIFFISCAPPSVADQGGIDSIGNQDTGQGELTSSDFELASWNVRILSNNSRDDAELQLIADIIYRYDFVAIQEVRDTTVLDRLEVMLPEYDYIASDPVGEGVKELYAFFYRADLLIPLGTAYIYGDPQDSFLREPYVAHFQAGEFDFTAITIHAIYGDSINDRRAEIAVLDDVLANVDEANGAEADVLLMGDFNLPADDDAWDLVGYEYLVSPSIKTTITDTSSYDNIWLPTNGTEECNGSIAVYCFDNAFESDSAASLAVSDHRPISTTFDISKDDDAPGNWTATAGGTNPEDGVDTGTEDPNDGEGEGGTDPGGEVTPVTLTSGDVRITGVVTQPTDSESITIRNYSTWPVDLSDWTIGDLNDPDSYGIPNGTLIQPGQSVTYSSQLNFGINNSGEIIYLKRNGVNVDIWP